MLGCHYNLNFLFRLNTTEYLYKKRMMKYLGLNQQLYDLGLSLNDLYNISAARVIFFGNNFSRFLVLSSWLQIISNLLYIQQEKIKEIDDDFDLVLISEDFDKSMVLLANKLCWPLDYVKSFKLNARKNSTKITLNEQERDILQSWQQGDMLLYNHFQNKLEKEVHICTLYILIAESYNWRTYPKDHHGFKVHALSNWSKSTYM